MSEDGIGEIVGVGRDAGQQGVGAAFRQGFAFTGWEPDQDPVQQFAGRRHFRLGKNQAEVGTLGLKVMVHQDPGRAAGAERLFHPAGAGEGVEVQEDQQPAAGDPVPHGLPVPLTDERFAKFGRGEEESYGVGCVRIQENAAFPGAAKP